MDPNPCTSLQFSLVPLLSLVRAVRYSNERRTPRTLPQHLNPRSGSFHPPIIVAIRVRRAFSPESAFCVSHRSLTRTAESAVSFLILLLLHQTIPPASETGVPGNVWFYLCERVRHRHLIYRRAALYLEFKVRQPSLKPVQCRLLQHSTLKNALQFACYRFFHVWWKLYSQKDINVPSMSETGPLTLYSKRIFISTERLSPFTHPTAPLLTR